MNVLHVISTLTTGGAESALAKVVERTRELGTTHTVASLRGYGATAARIAEAGTPVVDLGMRAAVPDPRGLARLVRLIRKVDPDVIQSWMYHADLMASIANPLAGRRPLVWNIRHSDFQDEQMKPTTRLTLRACRWLAPRAPDAIVSVSRVGARLHISAGYPAARVTVIPNGFDTDLFRPDPVARGQIRAELGIAPDDLLVGHVARYHEQKDHVTLVAAARTVAERRPSTRFLFCGTGVGDGDGPVRRMVERAGLGNRTCLFPARTDIPRVMAALDVYVSSSAFGEGFPNVIGEAMAAGVPPVATDVGDSAFIMGAAGTVVPPRDPDALASGLLQLLEASPAARKTAGEAARQRIVDEFDISKTARSYLELWGGVAAERRSPAVKGRDD